MADVSLAQTTQLIKGSGALNLHLLRCYVITFRKDTNWKDWKGTRCCLGDETSFGKPHLHGILFIAVVNPDCYVI